MIWTAFTRSATGSRPWERARYWRRGPSRRCWYRITRGSAPIFTGSGRGPLRPRGPEDFHGNACELRGDRPLHTARGGLRVRLCVLVLGRRSRPGAAGGQDRVLRLARRADDVLEKVGRVVSDNEGSINRTVQNVERFSQALGDNAGGIDRFLAQVGQAAEKVGPLAEKLETLATNVDTVVRAVDPQRVTRIVENVEGFTQALGESRQAVENTLRNTDSLVARLNETAPKLDSAVGDLSNIAKAIDPAKVGRTVDKVEEVANSVDGQRVSRI